MNSRPLFPSSDASWHSLVDELAEVQAFIYVSPEPEYRQQPGDPATEAEIATVESELRYRLPAEYRDLLKAVGGWRHMHEDTHLLGPGDLLDGPLFRRALQVLSEQDDVVLDRHGLRLQDLLPIAVSENGLDLMALIIRGRHAGGVLWTIGAEDTLYPSVRAWLEGLVADSKRLVAELLDPLTDEG